MSFGCQKVMVGPGGVYRTPENGSRAETYNLGCTRVGPVVSSGSTVPHSTPRPSDPTEGDPLRFEKKG